MNGSSYKSALRQAIIDYRVELESWKELDRRLSETRASLIEHDRLISFLWKRISNEDKLELEDEFGVLDDTNGVRSRELGRPLYRRIQHILSSSPEGIWTVTGLVDFLKMEGTVADAKSVSNILGRLTGMGQLERVERGQYRNARHRVLLGDIPPSLRDILNEASNE